jgi:redox-sensitive bicupin YhaK (pirin superfamily)
MTTQLFKANTRGTADFGWLKANFFLFFGNYFNPERVQSGKLRVLNDDTIAAGAGFGTHGHANMEIITIPLEGGLMHKDSMGKGIIRFGEVQVMSAGSGVEHSEMNASATDHAKHCNYGFS